MKNDSRSGTAVGFPSGYVMRRLREGDSLEELTSLLHRGYKRLADMNLRFVATYQDVETTRRRSTEGECHVVLHGDRLVGTITLYPPDRCGGCAWYDRPEVACFGQFTVDPGLQQAGIGSAMITVMEARARALGARELALDTAEPATHLIEYYARRGYRIVDTVQWDVTNYRSVIMSKRLPD